MYRLLRYIILMLFISTASKAQNTITLWGMVTNEDGQPLPGATIRLKLNHSTVSGPDGKFDIALRNQQDTLIISYVGYLVQKVAVSQYTSEFLEIRMSREPSLLDDVMVVSTGYQILPLERQTGSFEKIDATTLNRRVSSNILDRLEGVSSVYFDNRTGSSELSVRGRSTIMAGAAPLIVVDGFPYEGDINSLNPNDVERVTLLKDAAASSIWGVRAANGVLVIETHNGRYERKPTVEFNTNFTLGSKPDLFYAPAMSSADFIDAEANLFREGFYDSALRNNRFPVISPAVEVMAARREGLLSQKAAEDKLISFASNDVRNDLGKHFYRSAADQQYAISYSGGGRSSAYRYSAGYDKNVTYQKGNEGERVTLSSAHNFILAKGLEFNSLLNYTFRSSHFNSPLPGLQPTGKFLYPYADLVDDSGNALEVVKDYRVAYLDTAGQGKLLDWKYRPMEELQNSDNSSIQQNVRFNSGLKYAFDKYLNLNLTYQYEWQGQKIRNHYRTDSYMARNLVNRFTRINGGAVRYGIPPGAILDINSGNLFSHNLRGQLNYDKTWSTRNSLSLLLGSEVKQLSTSSEIERTYGYSDHTLTFGTVNYIDLLPTYNNLEGNLRIPSPKDFTGRILRFTSLYFNTGYSVRDIYQFSLSMRKDASNIFGVDANQKGVPLWSVGFGWNIEENYKGLSDKFKFLKARLNYGYSGNVDHSLSALTTLAYYSNSPLTGATYGVVRNPGNPELKWERSGLLNIGVDFTTRNSMVSGNLDFYIRNGKDLIGESPIDPTTGVTNSSGRFLYRGNVAQMRGSGIDASFQLRRLKGDLQWVSDIIVGYSQNKVSKYEASASIASAFVGNGELITPFEGKPVYAIYSYGWAGLDPQTGDPLGYFEGQKSKDYSGISSASPETLIYHGSAVPVVFGSFRNTVNFKKWSASLNVIYKLGYYFRRSSINYLSLFNNWGHHSDYRLRWQKPGDEVKTSVPSWIYPLPANRDAFYTYSEALVERGDHIRFQDVQLGYSLSRKCQVYAYINNLGILWRANRVNLDPDYYSGGFPLPATFSLGFKSSF